MSAYTVGLGGKNILPVRSSKRLTDDDGTKKPGLILKAALLLQNHNTK